MDPHDTTRPTRSDVPRATAPPTRTFGPQGPTLGDLIDAYLQDYLVRQFRSRAAVCGPRYAHQPARQAYRTGHTPSQVVLGGRKVAIRRPRARRAGEEVPLPTARAFANADPLNRRVVDQMLIGVATSEASRPPCGGAD